MLGGLLGGLLGGALPEAYGVTAPLRFAFVGPAVLAVLLWRRVSHIAHDEEPGAETPREQPGEQPGVGTATQ